MLEKKIKKITLCIIFLVTIGLLTSGVSASSIKTNEGCDTNDVKEEIVGLSPDGKDFLVKGVIVHYKNKEANAKSIKQGGTTTNSCSKTFSKWGTTPVSYVVNTSNSQGLDPLFIQNAIMNGVNEWDTHTPRNLVVDTYIVDNTVKWGVQDFKNAIVFGNVTDAKMDFQNIFTHEFGHGLGLSDIYTSTCNTQTMFGYSWEGDYQKRTLESGDISGLQRLYGI